jgi:Resolvase, N terminal domain
MHPGQGKLHVAPTFTSASPSTTSRPRHCKKPRHAGACSQEALDDRSVGESSRLRGIAKRTPRAVAAVIAPPQNRGSVRVATGAWRALGRLAGHPARAQPSGAGFALLTEALDLSRHTERAMAGLWAVFAEFEREILRERVRGGLAYARQDGKRLGWWRAASREAGKVLPPYCAGINAEELLRFPLLRQLLHE